LRRVPTQFALIRAACPDILRQDLMQRLYDEYECNSDKMPSGVLQVTDIKKGWI